MKKCPIFFYLLFTAFVTLDMFTINKMSASINVNRKMTPLCPTLAFKMHGSVDGVSAATFVTGKK